MHSRFRVLWLALAAAWRVALAAPSPVEELRAVGADSRIDLRWQGDPTGDLQGYHVYRSEQPDGEFQRLTSHPHRPPVYSDFVGENGRRFSYRITAVGGDGAESPPSATVSATTRAMTDEELLTSVQEATFRYFWDWGHPVSGLARERNRSRDTCTMGGTGFGMMAIMVGADRGFITHQQAAERLLKMVTFLEQKAHRYHGAWPHWMNGRTGDTIPFASKHGVRADDGGDIVETAFLVQGMLTVRQYFDGDAPLESELRQRITRLWRGVEWDWYLGDPPGKQLLWHWSPNYGWFLNHRIGGRFNECMIAYLLGIASPTHPLPASCYYDGWVRNPKTYANGNAYYGYKQWVGRPMGGPLFFTHYSFLGFDPRGKRDRFCNYFDNNRNISLIHRAYCSENKRGFKGYSDLVWGLTASDTPGGYRAHAPGPADNGTIAPTAALSAMPYTPRESLATLKHFYHALGKRLWGEFGFHDAFNLQRDWFASSYLAIDQGPIVVMIENYRSQLCWRMFMANAEVSVALQLIGWRLEN